MKMENNKKSPILEWFKKYILMRDLKEKSPEALKGYFRFFVGCTFWLSAILTCAMIYSYLPDFSKLQEVDGVLHTKVIVVNPSTTYRNPVMELYVTTESKNYEYENKIFKEDKFYINHSILNGQLVKIWYLPTDNKFYLIKFMSTDMFNDINDVKRNKLYLEKKHAYMMFEFPLLILLSTSFIIFIQILIIRYEIFRNYDYYFIDQSWDVKMPIKINMNLRSICVTMFFGVVLLFVNFGIILELMWL